MRKSEKVSRREFGRTAATALAAATLAPPSAIGAISRMPDCGCAEALIPQQDEQQPQLAPELKAEVEAKLQSIFTKWGDRLNDDQKTRMRTIVTQHVRMLQSVRSFKVANGDAPASVLKLIDARNTTARTVPASAKSAPATGKKG